MSSGAGHIQDMNNRIKQNRAQRPSNKAKFRGNNRDIIHSNNSNETLNFKTVSEEELTIIKQQIINRAKRNRIKERVIYALSIFISLCILGYLFNYVELL